MGIIGAGLERTRASLHLRSHQRPRMSVESVPECVPRHGDRPDRDDQAIMDGQCQHAPAHP